MVKKHHPSSRYERLKLKELHEAKKEQERAGRIRKRLYREDIKAKEAEDAIREQAS